MLHSAYTSEDMIKAELTAELPGWTMSAFGVAKHEPNLFYDTEISPEELRWKCVQAVQENRPQDYVCGVLSVRLCTDVRSPRRNSC